MSSWPWSGQRRWRTGAAALIAGHLGLLATGDLASRPFAALLSTALAFLGLVLTASGMAAGHRVSAAKLLLLAACLRVLLLPLVPTLSEDVLRYLWDGRVATAGFNPYELAPEAPELADLRNSMWEAMPHKDVPTVYPPAALALFSIAARLPQSLYVLKAVLALVELAGCAALVSLARRRGLGLDRVAYYALNPLVILETAGMGHVDALGVAASIAVVLWLVDAGRKPVGAAVWAGIGALAKLVPLAAVPMWSRQSGRARLFLAALAGTLVVGFVPLVAFGGGVPPGLVRYAVSWEFNGPLFEPMWRVLEWARAPDLVAGTLDGLKQLTGAHELWNRFYPYRYPQFLAKLVLWGLTVVWVGRSLARRDPVAGTGWLLGGVMLFSATVYPWYLLWILPWAALCRQRAWITLSGLILLSYLPQSLDLAIFPWFYLLIWTPFALLLMKYPRWSTD